MNITKLEISGYKNLNIKLEHKAKIISLIGNNGSGKSNLLEALSLIFKNLYFSQKTQFDYHIEYTIGDSRKIQITNNNSSLTYFIDGENASSISNYLPKKVVAIYSGEANRLWEDSYKNSYDQVIANINNNTQVDMPKMLLINKYYWHLSLLTLLLSDSEDNKTFIKEVLSIDSINTIDIVVNKSKYKHYKHNSVLELAKALEHKISYTLDELKNILIPHWTTSEIYTYLYLLFTPKSTKIIEDITVKFNDNLTIDSLSEGEKKLLLLKSAFEFAIQEDSLFLLDEPDAHIHVNNKERIIKLIEPFKGNRQVILTTHSPTVTKSISNDELFMMDNGSLIDKKEQEILDHLTGDFWSRHQQSSFLSSDKKVILLVEGKHDKIHLNNAFYKLKNDFDDLDFDVFSLGGESKIQPFMNGLYETNSWNNKIYIAVYDNDVAGKKPFEKSFESIENKNFRKLKGNLFNHNNFYAITLIKPRNFNADCTIESMFDSQKYQNAYMSAMNSYRYFSDKSIEEINTEIKEASKNLLAEQSSTFSKDDFKYFIPLFQLISQIQKDSRNTSQEVVDSFQVTEVPVNESLPDTDSNQLIEVYYKDAVGLYNPENQHLILKANSQIRKDYIPSFSESDTAARENLKSEIGIEEDGDILKTLNDYEFNSPSGAGKFVFCSNVNGRKVWKNADGRSLNQLYPKTSNT
ncbi:DUF4357 domain-containing protein [Psychrobacter celer]|uniref:DUF4357 domain-containing protein n=1 Tax=Psychrobacter celer TaxID=306572 RepID=UPI003FD42D29